MTTDDTPRPLRAEDFEPFVGREARFGDVGFALTLDSVERSRPPARDGMIEPFTLIFASPKGESYLMEGLYPCDFGGDAIFKIYVSPIHTADPNRQNYQAVFN